jgi:hypothetical protein
MAIAAASLFWSCGKDDDNKKRVRISQLDQSNYVPGTRIHPNVNQYLQPGLGNGGINGFNRANPNLQVARIPVRINSGLTPSIVPNVPVQVRGLNGWNPQVAGLLQQNPASLFGGQIPTLGGIGPVAYQPQLTRGVIPSIGVQGLCYLPNYLSGGFEQQGYQSPWSYFGDACGYNNRLSLSNVHLQHLQANNFYGGLHNRQFSNYYRYAVPHYNPSRWNRTYNPYGNDIGSLYGTGFGFGLNASFGGVNSGVNGRLGPQQLLLQQQQIWQQTQQLARAHAWGNTVYDANYLQSIVPGHVSIPQAQNGIYSVPFADGRVFMPQGASFRPGQQQYVYMLQCRSGLCPAF